MFKTIFNKLVPSLAILFVAVAPAEGQVYYTLQQLLSEQFQDSERVTFKRIEVTPALRQRMSSALGVVLHKSRYTFYVATSGDKIDGYALFDEERGQHEMISFATFFDPAGKVTRVEVTAYREAYGDDIRSERFRRQFVGKAGASSFEPNRDIDAISGATISSHSMCKGVKRASALLQQAVLDGGALAKLAKH